MQIIRSAGVPPAILRHLVIKNSRQDAGATTMRYGISCVGTTLVPARVKSNRSVQVLRTPRPPTLGGLNFQSCAAARAARAKYLLGPRDSSSASSTLPDRSTFTLTLTLTVPRMEFLADWSTSGVAW